jgi:hypothetical protein
MPNVEKMAMYKESDIKMVLDLLNTIEVKGCYNMSCILKACDVLQKPIVTEPAEKAK